MQKKACPVLYLTILFSWVTTTPYRCSPYLSYTYSFHSKCSWEKFFEKGWEFVCDPVWHLLVTAKAKIAKLFTQLILRFSFPLSYVDLSFYSDIPSPTRKKGSTSTSEDCVVPDIDDEDNVFNFEQPRVPAGMYFIWNLVV